MSDEEIQTQITRVKEAGKCGVWLGYLFLVAGLVLPIAYLTIPLGIYLVGSGRYIIAFKGPKMKVFLIVNLIINIMFLTGIITIMTFIGMIGGRKSYNMVAANVDNIVSEPGPLYLTKDVWAIYILALLNIIVMPLYLSS